MRIWDSYHSVLDVVIALRCIVFKLSACENSAEFPAESGCKANELTRYKVDTARRVLPYI